MASIILPSRWQRQPSGDFVLDWRNPLTQGMAHCYVGGDGYAVNRVSQSLTGTPTGVMGREARPDGIAIAGTGSAYVIDSSGNAPTALPLTIGVVAGARPNGNGPLLASFTPGSVGSAIASVGTGFIGNAYPSYQVDYDSGIIINDTSAESSLVNTDRAFVCRSLSATDHALIVGRRITTNTTSRTVVSAGAQVGLGRTVGHNFSTLTLSSTAWATLACMWFRGLDDAEAFEFNGAPWQIFRPRRNVLYFDAGGGAANLEGDAVAQASAQAALSVSVPLAGAGVAVASAAGALSLSLPLDAAATATANANGALSISVPLNAAAVSQALASASLTTSGSADLAGSASATAAASGNLTINVSLSGSAIAQAAASASLTTSGSADLAGNASASPSASASLTLAVPLSGAALTVSNAAGSLTHIVPLQSSAASASLATGGLDVAVQLNAAALAQALASAGLSVVSSGLSGSASASADANATLTLRINLEAAAVGNAVASGALASAGLIVSGTPGYTITRSQRAWEITRSQRAWRIAN